MQKNINNSYNKDIINIIQQDINQTLYLEELWWTQIAKAQWLKKGDKNANIFHQKANFSKAKNKITNVINKKGDMTLNK